MAPSAGPAARAMSQLPVCGPNPKGSAKAEMPGADSYRSRVGPTPDDDDAQE